MAQLDVHQANKIYRGTLDEVFSHRNEIPSGATVELKVLDEKPTDQEETRPVLLTAENDQTIALLESWIAAAPTDPESIREAEEDLREFKRNMNLPRKETGARLHYPEVE